MFAHSTSAAFDGWDMLSEAASTAGKPDLFWRSLFLRRSEEAYAL
jgi:hypothetical protein